MRRREKKPRSLKFYLCLMGILAGIYLVLVAILAIRNPPGNETGEASTSVSTEVSVSETKAEEPEPALPEADSEHENPVESDKPENGTAKTENEQDPVKEPKKAEDTDAYGRGKERYTAFDAKDIFTTVNVKIANEKEMRTVTGASFDTVKSYLNTYASRNGIEATRCRMLTHQYIGHYGDRIEIYMRFNDEEKTLVTVIYEPANSTHSSHVDVVPCEYTVKEIRKTGSC